MVTQAYTATPILAPRTGFGHRTTLYRFDLGTAYRLEVSRRASNGGANFVTAYRGCALGKGWP